ncbi:hypothetical protein Clacol_010041 [Clathrus columnatus]|uniref:Uncharacterized protein n=1 Tax=Clathrus columnatus TaxID=1419009 RepID=A0AAV5AT01_9AGAM|nr:hypothetical protein Clacol_010041 [Clathrus columnatus]
MARFTITFIPTSGRLPGGTGCIVAGSEADFWITFVSSLTFEVILVTFTIVRGIMHSKAGFAHRDTPLSAYLYRTGVLYFLMMGAVMAFMSATALTPLGEVVLPAQFLSGFVSSVCARMMISIRKVLEGDPDDRFSELRPSDMDINFDLSGFATSVSEHHLIPTLFGCITFITIMTLTRAFFGEKGLGRSEGIWHSAVSGFFADEDHIWRTCAQKKKLLQIIFADYFVVATIIIRARPIVAIGKHLTYALSIRRTKALTHIMYSRGPDQALCSLASEAEDVNVF